MNISSASGAAQAAGFTRDQMAQVLAARPGVANQAAQVAATGAGTPAQPPAVTTEGNGVDLYL